ncbi:uncharacterized protein [Aegilops tauschii subsp. strangulata]|uniref:uncharacterized protein isoform X2 n=1 Tax=Aegilops tauschii subsp. strangulata TaxID=200361 RepID=UPI001ABD3FAB|nr:uncharacterized protein LOC109771222 isoform X2 [Aegilops tauschii subsp. strangulata]XP_044333060.1 uncharacterized protein LOC123053626 isoform X2 [Triticum aestivum]XP_045089059.1 uncharacterized protein LOC109771222 isoform X2 [Aegilops tauschii subsp. strangulata]
MPAKIFQILSTQPPSLQEDFNEWSPRSCPKSYKRLRLDEPLTKTHLYSEFLHAKMDHQLRNMLANLSQVANKFFLIVILMMATDMDTCIHMGCFLRQCRPLIQLMMLKFSMALAPHTYGMFPPSMAQCCPLIQLMMLKFLMALACKAIQMWKIDLLVAMRELYMKKLYSISVKKQRKKICLKDLIDGVPLLKDVRGSPIIGSLLFESQGSGIT